MTLSDQQGSRKPSAQIEYMEFDKYILMYGSLLCMIENKSLNFQNFIIKLLENKQVITELMQITGTSNTYDLLLVILNRFPHLCNSKSIENHLIKHGRKLRQIRI